MDFPGISKLRSNELFHLVTRHDVVRKSRAIANTIKNCRSFLFVVFYFIFMYRIYSIKRPGRLFNFWTFRVGAYSWWALIKFSPFSVSENFIV